MLDRSFEASPPNRKWIADVTDIWTAEGWLYAAAVIDLYSRCVVGWSMSATMAEQLVTDALMIAIWRRTDAARPGEFRPARTKLGAGFLQSLHPLRHRRTL
jgi:transposase InsO family protein